MRQLVLAVVTAGEYTNGTNLLSTRWSQSSIKLQLSRQSRAHPSLLWCTKLQDETTLKRSYGLVGDDNTLRASLLGYGNTETPQDFEHRHQPAGRGEIRGPLKLFKMPTSSRARGVNTTQMSAGDPKSQPKLAVICTNTPPCLAPYCVCILKDLYSPRMRSDCFSSEGRALLLRLVENQIRSSHKEVSREGSDVSKQIADTFVCGWKRWTN